MVTHILHSRGFSLPRTIVNPVNTRSVTYLHHSRGFSVPRTFKNPYGNLYTSFSWFFFLSRTFVNTRLVTYLLYSRGFLSSKEIVNIHYFVLVELHSRMQWFVCYPE